MKKYFVTLVLVVALATGVASAATLSAAQINAIVSLLQSFGADTGTINNVQAALTGTSGVSAGTSNGTGTSASASSQTGVSQGISGSTDFVKLKITNSNPGTNETFVTATIKGTPDNKKVYLWRLEMLCPVGVIIYGKNSENICGQTLNLYTYNIYDPTQDYLALTVGMKNNSSQSAAVVLALYAYDSVNNKIGGDKAQVFLAAASTTQPSITVVSPNGGERLVIGSTYDLKWQALDFPANFPGGIYVELKPYGGGTATKIAQVEVIKDGYYYWKIPSNINPGQYKIVVYKADQYGNIDLNVKDESDNYFTIAGGFVTPSITVTSPNGGENWGKGTNQGIYWKTNFGDATVDISLVPYYPPCTTSPCPAYPYRSPYIIKNGVLNNGGFNWPVGQVVNNSGVVETAPDGNYYIQVCKASDLRTVLCDKSDNPFYISGEVSRNQPPIISGLSAPSNLTVGQTGTWVVKAYDPEGGTLAYTIDWGEPQSLAAKSSSVGQEASFTHSYAAAGTYKVSITVIDNAGQAAMTSATVVVGGTSSTPVPYVNVVSPNGGEIYTAGQTIPIQFSTNLTDKQSSGFVLQLYKKTTGSSGKMYSQDIVGNWAGGSPYGWTIPTTIPAGDYFIYIAALNLRDVSAKEVIDFSNGSFTISNPLTQTAATITVTSPQPNEIWRRGNVKTIMWTTTNLGTDAYIAIRAINSAGQVIDLVRKTWNSGQVGWNVGLTADGTQLPAGFYRIRACITGPTGGCDKSSEKMLEIKEKSDGTSTGTAGAVGASSPNLWNWLGKVILGQ